MTDTTIHPHSMINMQNNHHQMLIRCSSDTRLENNTWLNGNHPSLFISTSGHELFLVFLPTYKLKQLHLDCVFFTENHKNFENLPKTIMFSTFCQIWTSQLCRMRSISKLWTQRIWAVSQSWKYSFHQLFGMIQIATNSSYSW
jgi:hypothetical protein